MEKYLTNNPFFIEKKEKNQKMKYIFQKNENEKYLLTVRNNLLSPIGWEDNSGEVESLFETPKWFQKLYIKTLELHVKKNRVRLKVNNQKIHKIQAILCCCLTEKNGWEVYSQLVSFPRPDVHHSIDKKYQHFLEKIAHRAKKFDYEVIILEESGPKINFIIK